MHFDGVAVGITDIWYGHYVIWNRMITQSTYHDDRVVACRMGTDFWSKLKMWNNPNLLSVGDWHRIWVFWWCEYYTRHVMISWNEFHVAGMDLLMMQHDSLVKWHAAQWLCSDLAIISYINATNVIHTISYLVHSIVMPMKWKLDA